MQHLEFLRGQIETEIRRERAALNRLTLIRDGMKAAAVPVTERLALISAAGAAYGLDATALLSTSREANTTEARHVAMWLLRQTGMSYPQIGKTFGRDHTTVMSAIRRVNESPVMTEVAKRLNETTREAS